MRTSLRWNCLHGETVRVHFGPHPVRTSVICQKVDTSFWNRQYVLASRANGCVYDPARRHSMLEAANSNRSRNCLRRVLCKQRILHQLCVDAFTEGDSLRVVHCELVRDERLRNPKQEYHRPLRHWECFKQSKLCISAQSDVKVTKIAHWSSTEK